MMTVKFDRTNPRLRIEGIPLEANKITLHIPEYNNEGIPNPDGSAEAGNFSIVATMTLKAIKEETITVLEPVFNELGEQTGNNEVQQVQTTVLEEQTVNLSVL